ncbi:hypothetical protein [Polynucleobacter sp.]|uniref:hypothetical protein n=1 Tax=Polynucleobacter sp. TaxID=2029855 RepID=UPI003F696A6A
MRLKYFIIFFIILLASFSTESSMKLSSVYASQSSQHNTWTNREVELLKIAEACDQRNLELQKKLNQSIKNKRDRIGFWDARELGFFTLGVTSYAVGGFPLAGGSLIAVSVIDFISGFTLWGIGQ